MDGDKIGAGRTHKRSLRDVRAAAPAINRNDIKVVSDYSSLAPQVMEQMKSVFEALKAEGIAILFIEQNVRLALSIAGRGYILESGRLAIEGHAATLINSPEVRRIFLGG